jgi:hypothetical protein
MDDTSARADRHNRSIAGTLSTACCSRQAAITLVWKNGDGSIFVCARLCNTTPVSRAAS